MHTGRCCCKMDACWIVTTQSSCQSFVTQSCMSAGVVLLYLPYIVLVWRLTISRVSSLIIGLAFWCGASLSAMSVGVVLHYMLCLLVWCLIIGHAFWCDASHKAIPCGVVPHYQLCQLVGCLIIGLAFWCGALLLAMPSGVMPRIRPYRVVWCLTISCASWWGVSL